MQLVEYIIEVWNKVENKKTSFIQLVYFIRSNKEKNLLNKF